MKLLRDCFTGIDGTTWDIGRILWAKGVLVFLALEVFSVVKRGTPFDMQAFGIGLGTALAAGGVALSLKSKTEPGHA